MGKSTSCLKLIACGSDSADKDDDTHTSEAKGEGDKRGWSFRKKSTKRGVLSNSVVSEVHTSGNKETPEAVNINYQEQNTTISEKVASLHKPDDKPKLPFSVETKVADEKPQLPISDNSKVLDEKPKLSISTESKVSDQKDEVADEKPQLPIPDNSKVLDEKPKLSISTESKVSDQKDEVPRSVEADIRSDVKPQIPSSDDSKVSDGESQILTPVVEAKISDKKPCTPYSVEPDVSDEKPELPVAAEAEITEPVVSTPIVSNTSDLLDESDAITIQSSVRSNLAQRELAKRKSIVKLQAYARGHLVRMRAVQTLHCIQAIVKVQGLVRARQSRLKGKHTSASKPVPESIEKLLRNSFARQILEATPKPKSITVKCVPSMTDSTWNWFEVWMSASSWEINELQKQVISAESEEGNQTGLVAAKMEETSSQIMTESVDSKTNIIEETKSVEHNSDQLDASTCDSQSSCQLLAQRGVEQPFSKNNETPEELVAADMEWLPSQKVDSNSHIQKECSDLPETSAVESEPPKRSSKRLASEVLDAQGNKSVNGTKKATNPAFVAAKSKFKELSSAGNSVRSVRLSNKQDSGAESNVDTVSSAADVIKSKEPNPAAQSSAENILKVKEPSPTVPSTTDNAIKTNDLRPAEIPASNDSRVHIAASECGTELSISSTLDSPDRSGVETAELDHEVKHVEERTGDTKSSDANTDGVSGTYTSSLPSWPSVQPEEQHESNGKPEMAAVDQKLLQEEQKVEKDAYDVKTNNDYVKPVIAAENSHLKRKAEMRSSDIEFNENHVNPDRGAENQGSEKRPEKSVFDAQVAESPQREPNTYKSSDIDASPKSHTTVPESQGTPASQVSVKTRRNRPDKSGSKAKRSSLSASKKSPHLNQDSGASSVEKDKKSGKRRNSFGSTKSDNVDQGPRDSSSSSKTLPSYMQATESARMKANSPRSSPDVHDKDTYVKKRHSLPGAGGRQVSPVIQRTNSQSSPQGAKRNDRKWQR